MSSAETAHRSYLFVPGSRPAVMRKALASIADAVVLDLEDAVATDEKPMAREEVARLLDETGADVDRRPAIHVRVDRRADRFETLDVEVGVHPAVEALRLPEVEDADEVRELSAMLADLETARGMAVGSIALYPTIESARGVLRAEALASSDPRVARLVLGHADLLADLGAVGDDPLALVVPAATIALASRSAGIDAPVDGATTDLRDAEVLTTAIARARALGFFGKSAIHPRQLPAIHAAFTPSDEEFDAAARIVGAMTDAGTGAIELDGQLLDAATVRRARSVLALRRDP